MSVQPWFVWDLVGNPERWFSHCWGIIWFSYPMWSQVVMTRDCVPEQSSIYRPSWLGNGFLVWTVSWAVSLRKPISLHMWKQRCRSVGAVNVLQISAFVYATQIVQPLYMYLLNGKFLASIHLLLLNSPVCVWPGWNLQRQLSGNVVFVVNFIMWCT